MRPPLEAGRTHRSRDDRTLLPRFNNTTVLIDIVDDDGGQLSPLLSVSVK